jgi:N-hydroxyarylamine O-acetyltransferase
VDGEFDAYAERIAYRGAAAPTIDALEGICLAHAMRIPFENLDIHRGVPIDLARPALFAKLVARRRGGYCFEQNTLLEEMLRDVGFKVRPLAARVLGSETERVSRPRTHMILVVEIGVRAFLADVGFGVHNLLGPLPFEPDVPRTVHGERFRLREISWDGRATGAPPAFDLEVEIAGAWKALYRISLEHQEPPDILMAHWYTSTHPDSGFVRRKLVSRPEVGVRYVMRDRDLEIVRGAESERKAIADAAAYESTLREVFGIDLGEGPPLRW